MCFECLHLHPAGGNRLPHTDTLEGIWAARQLKVIEARSICTGGTQMTINNTTLMTEAVATIYSPRLIACQFVSLRTCCLILWCLLFGTGHVPLKWEETDVPPVARALGKGKCRHEQLQSVSQAGPCPHPWHTALFLHMPKQRWMMLQLGLGPFSPALPTLHSGRQSVFIVQHVTLQPADGGLPWPRWASRASLRNRRSPAWWLTATRAGFTTLSLLRYFLCFLCQLLPHLC